MTKNFLDCFARELKKRTKSQKSAKETFERYNKLVEANKKLGMGAAEAAEEAEKTILREAEHKIISRQKIITKSAEAQERLIEAINGFKVDGKNQPGVALRRLIEDYHGELDHPNFTTRSTVIKGQLQAGIENFIRKYSTTFGFSRPTEGLGNIVDEIHGTNTGDKSAKALAGAISDMMEQARLRANRAGANIPKLESWGLPHKHDQVKIKRAGQDAWVNFVRDKLDWEKIKDPILGGRVVEKDEFLNKAWETLITDGASKITPGEYRGSSALATRLHQHRVLHFKDGTTWNEYNETFGAGDLFDIVVNHTESMARDIAMMEVFGPNPEAMKRVLIDAARAKSAGADVKSGVDAKRLETQSVRKEMRRFETMWDYMTGKNGLVPSDVVAESAATARNMLTSAYLGSTSLLALPTDVMMTKRTAGYYGLKSSRFMRNYLRQMNPASSSDRAMAARFGIVNELAANAAMAQERMVGDVTGFEWSRRVSDAVMRASLLSPHTQAARTAWGLEMMGWYVDNAKKSFNQLHPKIQERMSKSQITPDDWDEFRKLKPRNENGATFLVPNDAKGTKRGDEIADKFMGLIYDTQQLAVPTSTLEARTTLTGRTDPGTFSGEVLRAFAQFKNFPISMIYLHGKASTMGRSRVGKVAGVAGLIGTLGVAGAFGLQMREIAKGRDPMPMNPATEEGRKFWGKAALSGGGMGIFGDFLFSGLNEYGGGLTRTMSGPTIGLAGDFTNLTAGNIVQLIQGEETKAGKEALDFMYRHMIPKPFWAKIALERMVIDQIHKQADPRAYSRFRRMVRSRQKDYGQDYWWQPGDAVPDRAPQFSD